MSEVDDGVLVLPSVVMVPLMPKTSPGYRQCLLSPVTPIIICTWMADVGPGSTPVLFGNLKQTYTLVDRRAVTLTVDPYSAGYCTLFKWEARVGGATTCPNASRLLRVK